MSQEYQSVGGTSPALDAVAAELQGHQGQLPRDPADQQTDARDYSFYADRANTQAIGMQMLGLNAGVSWAAYRHHDPMAGQPIIPTATPPPDTDPFDSML